MNLEKKFDLMLEKHTGVSKMLVEVGLAIRMFADVKTHIEKNSLYIYLLDGQTFRLDMFEEKVPPKK